MMSESIQQGSRHPLSLEDLPPVAEGKVAGDQQAAAFITVGKHLEQQFGSRSTERQIPELVHDQQVEFVQSLKHAIQCKLFLSFLKLIDQSRRCKELRTQTVSAGGESQ